MGSVPKEGIDGFVIYRAPRPEGEFTKITPEVIPAIDPKSGKEPKYEFVDKDLESDAAYYYSIRAVNEENQQESRIGPVMRIEAK